ncbi:MAG: DUF1822 family protein [Fischerella sp.]|uniref:DUF1822 family protein n=1 Tax=unclassified Fischerella TaxID=494603 RepID=UPI000478A89C|nr:MULTISPECIES: DUF1822 family protein [unclassified Fischerella]NWF60354.1 DUF1822 family protein [Fischerella sp.]
MINSRESLTFTVPLGLEAHTKAKELLTKYGNPNIAKQVYLNILAVYAVRFYLICMGIETNWETSSVWNPVMQSLMDVADLEVISLGKIECRPVLPAQKMIYFPPEVCSDRIGYVAVLLDESLMEATLLGFVKTVPESGELLITELRSLADLLHLTQPTVETRFITSVPPPINLSQWLKNVIDTGWQTVESLVNSQQQAELVLKFRSAERLIALDLENSNFSIQKGKLFDLGQESESIPIALVVGLIPASEREINICAKVCPLGGKNYLPEELELMVLDEKGIAVMQATARNTKSIQLNFSSEIGERFSVKVILGDVSHTEAFIA